MPRDVINSHIRTVNETHFFIDKVLFVKRKKDKKELRELDYLSSTYSRINLFVSL